MVQPPADRGTQTQQMQADCDSQNTAQAADASAVGSLWPGHAVLTVSDNGAGPPPDVAKEIFEPFVTSKPEGLGLGLPLVARCARRLDGEIQWDRVEQQTRFCLTFRVTIPTEKHDRIQSSSQ